MGLGNAGRSRRPPGPRRRFNEAEARGPRKCRELAAESRMKHGASMRPRPVGLGNGCVSHNRISAASGFNEAEARGPRKWPPLQAL